MAAHQAPPSLGFSRQEHWSGLPFPSPMHESKKWKWSHSAVSDPQQPPWTAAYQAPLSMGFSRQEYWSGVPLPSPVLARAIEVLGNKGFWGPTVLFGWWKLVVTEEIHIGTQKGSRAKDLRSGWRGTIVSLWPWGATVLAGAEVPVSWVQAHIILPWDWGLCLLFASATRGAGRMQQWCKPWYIYDRVPQ